MSLFLCASTSRVLSCEIAVVEAGIDCLIQEIYLIAIVFDGGLIDRELLLRLLGVGARNKFEDLHLHDILELDHHGRLLLVLEGQAVLEERQSALGQCHKYCLVDFLLSNTVLSCLAIPSIPGPAP